MTLSFKVFPLLLVTSTSSITSFPNCHRRVSPDTLTVGDDNLLLIIPSPSSDVADPHPLFTTDPTPTSATRPLRQRRSGHHT